MVLQRAAGLPQGLEVTGHGAGGVDDHVLLPHELVEGAEDLGLGGQGPVVQVVAALGGLEPGLLLRGDLLGVGRLDAVVRERLFQGRQGLAGVGHHHLGALLGGVEGGDVDVHELHVGVLELGLGGRGEVGVAGAHADDEVGLVGDVVAGVAAGGAHAAHGAGVVEVDGALAGLGVAHRDAGGGGQGAQLLAGSGVDGAAAGDDEGALGGLDEGDGALQGGGLGHRAAHVPHALAEQLHGPVEDLGLDVLGHGDGDRAGLGGVGEHAHGAQQRGDELLGPVDAVEEARDGAEGVIDADVQAGGVLQLLEHGVGDAGGELVGGEEQHRQAVGGGQGGPGDHVEGARADGGRAHVGLEAVGGLGEGGGRVHLPLLVAGHDVGHLLLAVGAGDLILQEGLADAGHVAVTEDAEGPGDEALLDAVALGVLVGQETDGGLGDRQADRAGVGFVAHRGSSLLFSGGGAVERRIASRSWGSWAGAGRPPGPPRSDAPRCGGGRRS